MEEQDKKDISTDYTTETVEKTDSNSVEQNGNAVATGEKVVASKKDFVVNFLLVLAICAMVVFIGVRTFFVCNVEVQQTSMTPTIASGTVVRVNKQTQPQRGDIVVFYTEDISAFAKFFNGFSSEENEYKKLIKRVVAVGGDSIWVEPSGDGYILMVEDADGNIFRESYKGFSVPLMYSQTQFVDGKNVRSTLGILAETSSTNKLTLQPDTLFVMGDNRYDSVDSRTFGAIKTSQLFGVVVQLP